MTSNAGGLYELRVAPADSHQGKWGPWLYNHKEVNSASNVNKPGGGFFLSLQMRTQPLRS